MRKGWNSTCWVVLVFWMTTTPFALMASPSVVSLQDDGSLVISDGKGSIADFVKQGTPRQSIQVGGQSCNVSYGFNSAGKKTILFSVPAAADVSVVFDLGVNRITIPPKGALRLTLNQANQIEKQDGNPANTVKFEKLSSLPSVSPGREMVEIPKASSVPIPAPPNPP